jgi:hypothetical protein
MKRAFGVLRGSLILVSGLTIALSGAAQGAPCIGDCNDDRVVNIPELILAVNVALGRAAFASCPAGDGGDDGTIAVSDLVSAVNVALSGCPPVDEPSPHPSVTPMPTANPGASGACYESSACDPCDVYPCRPFSASREYCCSLTGGGGTFSWCPQEHFDATTLACAAQCTYPCAGLPTRTRPTGPTPTPSQTATPTSCRAVIPVVAPVTSPTDTLEQTIYFCGIGYASSRVNACGPAGCVEQYTTLGEDCPLRCPDPRQACVAGTIPLLENQVNAIQVCQVPGIGCGPLPDLCAEEDVNGAPLTIEQRTN